MHKDIIAGIWVGSVFLIACFFVIKFTLGNNISELEHQTNDLKKCYQKLNEYNNKECCHEAREFRDKLINCKDKLIESKQKFTECNSNLMTSRKILFGYERYEVNDE